MINSGYQLRVAMLSALLTSSFFVAPLALAQANSTNISGSGNNLQATASNSAIVTGQNNTMAGTNSAIIGAANASVQDNLRQAFIGGGNLGTIRDGAYNSAMVGGFSNQIGTNAAAAFIGGGVYNTVTGSGGAVVGGFANEAAANSFAAGRGAVASNTGTFVWSDSSLTNDFVSTSPNQFLIRSKGGVGINTNNPQGLALSVNGPARVFGKFISGIENTALGYYAAVGGGAGNSADGYATTSAGGASNRATNSFSTVSGGWGNKASDPIGYSSYGSGAATVGGGYENTARGFGAVVGGGLSNVASGYFATIPGGTHNFATNYSFAAGTAAKAVHNDSFVWSDNYYTAGFESFCEHSFNIRAIGGVRLGNFTRMYFGTETRQMLNLWDTNYAIGVQSNALYFRTGNRFYWYKDGTHSDAVGNSGGGSVLMALDNAGLRVNGTFVSSSDRNVKQDIRPVNAKAVLNKVASMPVSEWSYKASPEGRHYGPMAQDFRAAFGLGTDDKSIAMVDADGVALASIKGLVEELKERDEAMIKRDKTIEELRAKNNELSRGIEVITSRLDSLLPAP